MLTTRALSSKIEIEYILFTSDSKVVFYHWIKKSQLISFFLGKIEIKIKRKGSNKTGVKDLTK